MRPPLSLASQQPRPQALELSPSSRITDMGASRGGFLDEIDCYHRVGDDIFESTLCIGHR